MYLDVVDNHGDLAGTMRVANLDGERVTHDDGAFTGLVSDGRVTLKFYGGSLSGRVEGNLIRVTVPATDSGALREVDFKPGDLDDFNTALTDLQGSAGEATAARRAAQQAAAEAQQEAQQRTDVQRARQNLTASLANLTNWIGTATSDLYVNAWSSYGVAMQTLNDADAALSSAIANGEECGDIRSHMGDVRSARGDVRSAHGDYQSSDGDASTVVADGERFVSDVEQYAAEAGESLSSNVMGPLDRADAAMATIANARSDAELHAASLDADADRIVEAAETKTENACF